MSLNTRISLVKVAAFDSEIRPEANRCISRFMPGTAAAPRRTSSRRATPFSRRDWFSMLTSSGTVLALRAVDVGSTVAHPPANRAATTIVIKPVFIKFTFFRR